MSESQNPPPLSPDDFAALTGVSRETRDRFAAYADLLVRWQPAQNLVAASTLKDLWRRHFLDSAQLLPLLPPAGPVVDLGSGAGFPGLALALLGAPDVHLIESNARKCAFLREAARVSGTTVTVHHARIETVTGLAAAAVTARALAPLTRLLDLARPLLAPDGVCLFLKGAGLRKELTEAEKRWNMQLESVASIADTSGNVLRILRFSEVD
jgi:16S rRNA (guanine527-N7)-methyltransferase